MDCGFAGDLRRSHRCSSVAELNPSLTACCCLCHCSVSSHDETGEEPDSRCICGDCKFLLLEDLDSPEACRSRVNFFDSDDQSLEDGYGSERSVQLTSSDTTPTGSRRLLDLGNDEVLDYLYGETESDTSFRRYYRVLHSEADTNSEVSIDDDGWMIEHSSSSSSHSSHPNSDTDIDPMNAGHVDWNESEWEEDADHDHDHHQLDIHLPSGMPRKGEEAASSASILSRLPCVAIKEEEDSLNPGCAICKDSFSVGSLAKQLPCFHLYHPRCISRWLSTKNTCPLCRYQLPTDDGNHEYTKQIPPPNDDALSSSSSGGPSPTAPPPGSRNRLLLVAGPVIGLVGFSLMMLWLGVNPSSSSSNRVYGSSSSRRGSK